MKFIRTKDERIIDRTDFTCWKSKGNKGAHVNGTLEDNNNLELFLKYKNTSIIKQADTIEELCDEFVCIGSAEYQKYVKHSLKEALQKKEWLERKGYTCNIYGAIFTDKGLIYVAKMNEKGELELL